MRPAVAVNHGLGDLGLKRQKAFDACRSDHIAARVLDEVALPVSDEDVAVSVKLADIASMQPSVFERPRRCFGVAPITLHDESAANEDLAILRDFDLDAVERRTNRMDLDL